MSILPALDGTPLAFALTIALACALLATTAWLETAPRRHAPHVSEVSVAGLGLVGLAALAASPIVVVLAILVLWGAALLGYELGWLGWSRAHRRTPRPR